MAIDIKRFDIYRKVPKDLTQPTYTGACISICCVSFMLLLALSELSTFVSPQISSDMFVDSSHGHAERIPVFLNVSLPEIACKYVGLDIQDDEGRHEVGFVDNTQKTPSADGKGCLFVAHFNINRVPGNFHVSTHSSSHQPDKINFGHVVNELRFGEPLNSLSAVEASFNALEGYTALGKAATDSHDYIMKIVPTIHVDVSGRKRTSFQYTFVYRTRLALSHTGRFIPAVWFRYDVSPITVRYHEKRPPFYTFITTLCAIVGGTFTVASLIDSAVFTASELFKKFEIGKLS